MKPRIEAGILIPPRTRKRKYPFQNMKVGDSFLLPSKEHVRLAHASSAAGKRLNMRFTVRKVADGTRVWRTK